ncbi:hypothetical protein CYMTET_35101, partial [Cymbomonas tetramitiformis]
MSRYKRALQYVQGSMQNAQELLQEAARIQAQCLRPTPQELLQEAACIQTQRLRLIPQELLQEAARIQAQRLRLIPQELLQEAARIQAQRLRPTRQELLQEAARIQAQRLRPTRQELLQEAARIQAQCLRPTPKELLQAVIPDTHSAPALSPRSCCRRPRASSTMPSRPPPARELLQEAARTDTALRPTPQELLQEAGYLRHSASAPPPQELQEAARIQAQCLAPLPQELLQEAARHPGTMPRPTPKELLQEAADLTQRSAPPQELLQEAAPDLQHSASAPLPRSCCRRPRGASRHNASPPPQGACCRGCAHPGTMPSPTPRSCCRKAARIQAQCLRPTPPGAAAGGRAHPGTMPSPPPQGAAAGEVTHQTQRSRYPQELQEAARIQAQCRPTPRLLQEAARIQAQCLRPTPRAAAGVPRVFLATPWSGVQYLRLQCTNLQGADALVAVLLTNCYEWLDQQQHFFQERHMLLRAIPVTMLLLCPPDKAGWQAAHHNLHSKQFSMSTSTKRLIDTGLRHLKQELVVPIYRELHVVPAAVLQLAEYFSDMTSSEMFGIMPPSSLDAKTVCEMNDRYSLASRLTEMQAAHDDYCSRFGAAMSLATHMRSKALKLTQAQNTVLKGLVNEGFHLLSRWSGQVAEQSAWKGARPAEAPPSSATSVPLTPRDDMGGLGTSEVPYEHAVRFNYSTEDKLALLHVLGYIKRVAGMLLHAEGVIMPYLWAAIGHEVQQFVQNTMAHTILAASKKKGKDGTSLQDQLLKLRAIVADWEDHVQPSLEQAKDQIYEHRIQDRSCAPTIQQLMHLRQLVGSLLVDAEEDGTKKVGMLQQDKLSPASVKEMQAFYNTTLWEYEWLLDYHSTVKRLSCTSNL